jgi:hypothetical protein
VNKTRVAIPTEAFSGEYWWSVPALVEVFCPGCESLVQDQPTVLRYSETLDADGEQAEFEPLWAERGWLVHWACRNCGWDWREDDTYGGYVTTDDIERWISEWRDWHRRNIRWRRLL